MNYEIKLQQELDKIYFRNIELNNCKTQEEKNILLDRWNIHDSAEMIANSIRSSNRMCPRFLGIY